MVNTLCVLIQIFHPNILSKKKYGNNISIDNSEFKLKEKWIANQNGDFDKYMMARR